MNLTVGTNNRATARRTDSCAPTPNQTMGYDAAGNLTSEPGRTYQYDGEGRIKSVNSGAVAAYAYDGEGRRAVKTSGAGTRIYFYDAFGNPILESANAQGAWLAAHAFFNGRHVYENTGQLLWRHVDHLGSAAVRTDVNGAKVGDWRYYPFGERAVGSAAVDPYEFTGKERDAETGLDYFGARHYGNHLGRFNSRDPIGAGASLFDPQSWNGYSYVNNRPLNYVDPDGHVPIQVITGAVGGGVGAAVGAGFEAWRQRREYGEVRNWGKVGTAALGGAAAGALAGATLGVGAAAGTGATAVEVATVTAGSNVIGGMVQRRIDEGLGYEAPADFYTESVSVATDLGTGLVFGSAGGRIGEKLFPIPNVRREIALIRMRYGHDPVAGRAAAIELERRAELRAGLNSVTAGVAGGVPTEGTKWFLRQWLLRREPVRPSVRVRVCFEEAGCLQ
jgi:RHS repeat-associated protein